MTTRPGVARWLIQEPGTRPFGPKQTLIFFFAERYHLGASKKPPRPATPAIDPLSYSVARAWCHGRLWMRHLDRNDTVSQTTPCNVNPGAR